MRFKASLRMSVMILLAPLTAHGIGIRESHPNPIGGELGGRAVLMSGGYERYITNRVGIGVRAFGLGTSSGGVGVFPVYVSVIPAGDVHGLYLSLGVTLIASASNWEHFGGTG